MKKVDSAIASNNAAGDGWFKVWDEGYDETAGKWCINKLIENDGHLSVTVPSDIEEGYYLVRPELLALHAAQDSPPDPQFYVGCAQIYLESSGSSRPATVTIPENYVNMDTPGLTFNVWAEPLALPYPLFGPPAYQGGGNQQIPASSATTTPASSVTVTPASSTRGTPASSVTAASPSTSPYVEGDETVAEEDNSAENENVAVEEGAVVPEAPAVPAVPATPEEPAAPALPGTPAAPAAPAAPAGYEDAVDEEDPIDEEDPADEEAAADDECEADENEVTTGELLDNSTDDDEEEEVDAPSSSSSYRFTKRQNSPSYPSGQTEGRKPSGCIMVNGNWCGFEVASYSNENGCWSSSANCWEQATECFDTTPPTGAKNCELWSDKCNNLDDSCNAKQFTGPPDAGKDLTPTPPNLAMAQSRKFMALVRRHESHVMKRAYRARE